MYCLELCLYTAQLRSHWTTIAYMLLIMKWMITSRIYLIEKSHLCVGINLNHYKEFREFPVALVVIKFTISHLWMIHHGSTTVDKMYSSEMKIIIIYFASHMCSESENVSVITKHTNGHIALFQNSAKTRQSSQSQKKWSVVNLNNNLIT